MTSKVIEIAGVDDVDAHRFPFKRVCGVLAAFLMPFREETEAINLADTEARVQGARLDDYERPKVDHSAVKGRWSLFYGLKEFEPTVHLLQIFSIGILLIYIDFVLLPLMFAFDRQRKLSIMAFAAMLLNIGLNLMMIPYFQARYGNGGIGAALGEWNRLAVPLFSHMAPKAYAPMP